MWTLAELHLSELTESDFFWEPTALTWSVRPDDAGVWRSDWAETEPDPVPVPTIGWLTWHIMWWWSTAVAHVTGATPPDRVDVTWPGNGAAAVSRLRDLAGRWRATLTELTDDQRTEPSTFPWGADANRTIIHTALWVNVELTKNIAEVGQLRLMRAASA